MKILALHGFRQNGEIIKSKLKKLLGSDHEFICPTGKYPIENETDLFGWWNLPSIEHITIPHSYEGLEANFELITGTYDLVVGFSQGAVLATIGIGLGIIKTSKIILISPSDIMDLNYRPKEVIPLECLIITGESDELCSIEISKELGKYYSSFKLHSHKYGHVIPSASDDKKVVKEYFASQKN